MKAPPASEGPGGAFRGDRLAPALAAAGGNGRKLMKPAASMVPLIGLFDSDVNLYRS